MIHIVLALDEKYYHKANEHKVFDSIYHNTYNNADISVKVLCIGFDIPSNEKNFNHRRWSWKRCEADQMQSYREGWPKAQKTRPYFVCGEGGEFLDYFNFLSDDLIIHIDADVTMQRLFASYEWDKLKSFQYGDVGGTFHTIPSSTLEEEFDRLRPNEEVKQAKKHFPLHWEKPIFCTGVIVATAQTYRDVIYPHYLSNIDKMVMLFDHHAAGQWLMCQVVYEHGNFVNLGHIFQHANWFLGSDKKDIKDNKLCYNGSVVLFNHHKFPENKIWDFK